MSTRLTRSAPLGARELLSRMLDRPNLVAAIQSLPAPALGKLVNHVGLEDAGELVALATSDQIRRIFDDDLWRSERPGQDERFDADRFALWLEVMLEAGEAFAAQRLAELPEDLVTLALAKQVLVINIEEMAIAMSSRGGDDDAMVEKALESCLCEEIDEYRIIARRHEGWDAVLGVLLALDREHHDYLARLLARCCYASSEHIEENGGLYHVLTSEEMLESDAAAEREDRRAEEGYISPSSAASFLALARTTALSELIASEGRDPITRMYFRSLRRPEAAPPATGEPEAAPAREAAKLVELLIEAEVLPRLQAIALLEAPCAAAMPGHPELLGEAMRRVHARSPIEHARRMEELAFVANALQAGARVEGRGLRPAEAARAAMATCNLGLERLVQAKRATVTAALAGGADRLFRIGWRLLAEEVVGPAARRLEASLAKASLDRKEPTRARAAAALRSAIGADKPWVARRKLLDVADRVCVTTLIALIDECPHLDGELSPIPPAPSAELTFISSEAALRTVKEYLERP